jgi:hypothetical protein
MPPQKKIFNKNETSIFILSRKKLMIICVSIIACILTLMTIAAFFDYQID